MVSGLLLYDDIHPTFCEALAVWQAFRILGFSSSDVYFRKARTLVQELPGLNTARDPNAECFALFVELHFRGTEFTVCAGELDDKVKDFESEWIDFAKEIESGKHSDFIEEVWEKSRIRADFVLLMFALQKKGIPINQNKVN